MECVLRAGSGALNHEADILLHQRNVQGLAALHRRRQIVLHCALGQLEEVVGVTTISILHRVNSHDIFIITCYADLEAKAALRHI